MRLCCLTPIVTFTLLLLTFLDAGEDLVPEPADEAEETRQGEPASHRKRKCRQRDLAEYKREFTRRVSRSNGPATTSGRQPLVQLSVTTPSPRIPLCCPVSLSAKQTKPTYSAP